MKQVTNACRIIKNIENMNSQEHASIRKKNIKFSSFNKRVAIRNILFVIALCLSYIYAKHHQASHQSSVGPTSNTMTLQRNNIRLHNQF